MFSKKAKKIDEIFTVAFETYYYTHNVKSTMKILSNFAVFLEIMNFKYHISERI